MARAETIIVGGGVGGVAPFTVGQVTFITSTSPPEISATPVESFTLGTGGLHPGIIFDTATPNVDPQPAANEVIRTARGIISEKFGSADSVILGRAVGLVATQAVAIGTQAVASSSQNTAVGFLARATATGCIAIGGQTLASANGAVTVGGTATGTNATALGSNTIASATSALALGANNTEASGIAAIAIGIGTIADANGAICIGGNIANGGFTDCLYILQGGFTGRSNNQTIAHGGTPTNISAASGACVIVGGGAMTVTHANNIILAQGFTSFAANVAAIGGTLSPITLLLVGRGDTATAAIAAGLTIRGTNLTTNNDLDAGPLNLDAPLGTGNATNKGILLRVGQAQGAGNTQHVQVVGAVVVESTAADDMYLEIFDFTAGALKRVSRGIANSGGVGFRALVIPN